MKTVKEGSVEVEVPDVSMPEEGEVFYNPHMALARDLTVAIYSQYEGTLCDALAASGVRGLRLADKLDVTVNDANPKAVELIKKNAELNGLNVRATNEKANALLSKERFDIVDLDPFGSPVPFLDMATKSAKKILGICATDTAPLSGVYKDVCKRRYLATPLHTEYFKEAALRILCGYTVRNAAKYDIALRPIFVHATRHYYRAYFEVSKGATKANKLLKSVGTWDKNKRCEGGSYGPLWLGNLWDPNIVEKAQNILETKPMAHQKQALKLLEIIKGEIDAPLFYHDYHKLCKELKVSPPVFGEVLKAVEGKRTHFLPTGIKTKLSRDQIKDAIMKIVQKG